MKGRVKFTIAGRHPLLLLCRDYLIQEKKYALVLWSSDPDFCLYGAALSKDETLHDALHRASLEASLVRKVPTVLLSTSSMYPACEGPDEFVVRPWDSKALFSLTVEAMLQGDNLVLRPCNVYGPDVTTGVVYKFVQKARQGQPLSIRGNGYQVRSFLHQDDFLEEFGRLLGTTGSVILASNEEISINRLADSIWRAMHGPDVPTEVERVSYPSKELDKRCKIHDNRVEGSRKCISLRKGIWLLIQ